MCEWELHVWFVKIKINHKISMSSVVKYLFKKRWATSWYTIHTHLKGRSRHHTSPFKFLKARWQDIFHTANMQTRPHSKKICSWSSLNSAIDIWKISTWNNRIMCNNRRQKESVADSTRIFYRIDFER